VVLRRRAALLLALVLFGAACSPSPPNPARATPAPTPPALAQLKIAYASPAIGDLPFYAAESQGFFQQHGLEVSMVLMPGTAAIAALSNGEIDFTDSPGNAVEGATRGLPLKVVFSAWKAAPWTLVGKPEIGSVSDLKGKIVAANQPGSSPYVHLRAALREVGLGIDDVTVLVTGGTQNTFTTLVAGQADAGVLTPPYDAQAAEKGFHEVQFLGRLLKVPYIGLGSSERVLQTRRPETVRLLRALLDADAWLAGHPNEAVDLVSSNLKIPAQTARPAVERMLSLLSDDGAPSLEGVQQGIDIQAELAQRPSDVAAQAIVELGPLQEAASLTAAR
jgi:ABC-type nitrate/sulfonate/bicarbonate transport system substrate-binding protein